MSMVLLSQIPVTTLAVVPISIQNTESGPDENVLALKLRPTKWEAAPLCDRIHNQMEGIIGLVVLAICVALYFLPSIVGKDKRNIGAIFTLNLLLGWTLIGWVVALVWAMTQEAPLQVVIQGPMPPAGFCLGCGTAVPANSQFCGKCGHRI